LVIQSSQINGNSSITFWLFDYTFSSSTIHQFTANTTNQQMTKANKLTPNRANEPNNNIHKINRWQHQKQKALSY